jgi:hypothetical protein
MRLMFIIPRKEVSFDRPIWNDISEDAKLLIGRLLHKNPAERITLQNFLSSAWLTSHIQK